MLQTPPAGSALPNQLPRAAPQALGIDPTGILAFLDAVHAQFGGLHGFMLLRHGQVAAEGWWHPYAAGRPHMLFSLSKSFTSTAVGLAVAEGRLTVDDPVLGFFPEETPASVGANLAAMRVRHLLSMSTGHDQDATGGATSDEDGNWARGFLAQPVEHDPGTHFAYNSAATYMLSAIVQKLTGRTLLDYLEPRLFRPLGIVGATWETCPRGICTGGWGLSLKAEDIARFGQLYLQRGRWNGEQLLPEAWIAEATSKQIPNDANENPDWRQGYGYQFWRCRHGAYRGDGAHGQFCIVMPTQDAVVAITSGIGNMQAVLDLVWEHLLPAIGDPQPLRSDAGLARRLSDLAVPPPEGAASTSIAQAVSGRPYRLEENEGGLRTISVTLTPGGARLKLTCDRGDDCIECGASEWLEGVTDLWSGGKVAARGAWSDVPTYTARLCFYETPFIRTITCRFDGDDVTVHMQENVGFGPTEHAPIRGHAT